MTNWTERLHQFNPSDRTRDGTTGLVFDIQRFSVHDGPGIRTTVFLKGCPLHCIWCQNPESITRQPEITHITNKCIACHKCLEVCPESAVGLTVNGAVMLDRGPCSLCGQCIDVCYAGALNIFGRYLTVPELMDEVERDRPFFIRSGGGVTFSGGEATTQSKFLLEACREAKAHRLHTAIDTCGYIGWETFQSILRYVDLVLYDIKHMDSDEHRRLTGVPNELILENLERIASLGLPVYIRLPLVPECNDSPENVQATASFAASLPNVQRLDILPYHRLGEPKWQQLGLTYELQNVDPPDREHVYELADLTRVYDIEVGIGG